LQSWKFSTTWLHGLSGRFGAPLGFYWCLHQEQQKYFLFLYQVSTKHH